VQTPFATEIVSSILAVESQHLRWKDSVNALLKVLGFVRVLQFLPTGNVGRVDWNKPQLLPSSQLCSCEHNQSIKWSQFNKVLYIINYNIAFVNSECWLAKSCVDITQCQQRKFLSLYFFVLYSIINKYIKHFSILIYSFSIFAQVNITNPTRWLVKFDVI
jgi:hypothetical protein